MEENPRILEELQAQRKQIEEVMLEVRKLRRYFLWFIIAGVAAIVLPLIPLLFIIPSFIGAYSDFGTGL